MSNEAPISPIKFTHPQLGDLSFNSIDDLQTWFAQEQKAIEPILNLAGAVQSAEASKHLQDLKNAFSGAQKALRAARNIIDQFENEKAGADEVRAGDLRRQVDEAAQTFASRVRSIYTNRDPLWHSSSPETKFIHALVAVDRNEALYAFLHLRGVPFETNLPAARNGVLKAQLFRAGVTETRAQAEGEAIADIKRQWYQDAEEMRTEFKKFTQDVKSFIDSQALAIKAERTIAAEREEQFKAFVAAKDQDFLMHRQAADDQLKKLIATYDQHLRLKAPVEYWRTKKERHVKGRNWLILLTGGVGGIAFLWLWSYVETNFHASAANQIPWREIVGFVVLSSIVFWMVRILVRLLLSSIHLAEDAAEREVMATTYMALMRGDESKVKYLDEKDRALVLAPLFRPSSTGIVSDDSAPPHFGEMLARIIGRK